MIGKSQRETEIPLDPAECRVKGLMSRNYFETTLSLRESEHQPRLIGYPMRV